MITKIAQIAAKVESAEGTAETLAAADALLIMNPEFKPDIEMAARDNVASSLSPFPSVAGARKGILEFDVEVKGSGAAGTAPALGKLLKACGFGETVQASVSVTYKPASTGVSSLTLALYNDGVIYKIWGARGNVSLKLEKGKPGLFHYTFTGSDFSVADGAVLSAVTYEATKPQAFLAATYSLDSYAALVGLLAFDMQNEIALRPDINAASGHKSAVITGRNPKLSIDPEMVTVATYDFFGKWRSAAEGALSALVAGTAGNICTITAPKVQYVAASKTDKSGLASLGIDCKLNRNAGDDEISIAFT